MAVLSIAFAGLTIFGSSAQAASWPWEAATNTISSIMNVCGPNDVPAPISKTGPQSATVVPQFGGAAGTGGDGLIRLENAVRNSQVGDEANVVDATSIIAGVKNNGFERYGYNTLYWDQYGSSCFVGPGQIFTGPANGLFAVFVTGPSVVVTAILNFAMSNIFYDFFYAWVGPFMGVISQIFAPWVLTIVLIGGSMVILIQSKGSLARILKMSAWMMAMLAIYFGVANHGFGERIRVVSNNVVTQATNLIACQIATADPVGNGMVTTNKSCGLQPTTGIGVPGIDAGTSGSQTSGFRITGGIDQAIWYQIPYQVWSQGAVGAEQYKIDKDRTTAGQVSWSAAILNARHVNPDDALGKQVRTYSNLWNQAGYQSTGDDGGQKMRIWTDPDDKGWKDEDGQPDKKAWDTVPYLGVVKAMCNDVSSGTGKSEEFDQNRWMYQGNCDAAGANVQFVPSFKGDYFWERGAAIVAGSMALTATAIPLVGAAFYLMIQKMIFYFILLFLPIFLGIGAFPDEKRMGFIKRYGEMFVANMVKQIVAVCVVLFVISGVSGVLTHPNVAWWMKPMGIMMFTFGLILFAIPLARILKAAAKGDTSIVDKTLNTPQRVAKGTAKAAGVVAIAGLTLGAGAIAAGGAAAGGAASAAGGAGAAAARGAGMATAKKGLGGLAKGAAKGAFGVAKGGIANAKAGGLKGAAEGMTNMVKSGQALQMVRYSGLGEKPIGQLLRKGLGLGQVGLGMMGRVPQRDIAVEEGLNRARVSGIAALDKADLASGTPRYDRTTDGSLTREGSAQAEADYNSFYEGDQWNEKADSSQKSAQRQVWSNYHKMTGKYLPDDPSNPEFVDPSTPKQTAENIASQMSSSSWSTQVKTESVKSGEEILKSVGGSEAILSSNPKVAQKALGDLYQSYGSMANIDPTHPAAASMVALGFAAASDDPAFKEAAYLAAGEDIQKHGVPNRISSVHASEEFAAGFSPAEVLATMPTLNKDSSMQDRAAAAGAFTVGSMTVAENAPYAQSVEAYRAALLDPGMPISEVNALKETLANDILKADSKSWAEASTAFVTDATGTTGFNIGGESTLNWAERQKGEVVLAGAGVGAGAAQAAASVNEPVSASQQAAPFDQTHSGQPGVPVQNPTVGQQAASAPVVDQTVTQGAPTPVSDAPSGAWTTAQQATASEPVQQPTSAGPVFTSADTAESVQQPAHTTAMPAPTASASEPVQQYAQNGDPMTVPEPVQHQLAHTTAVTSTSVSNHQGQPVDQASPAQAVQQDAPTYAAPETVQHAGITATQAAAPVQVQHDTEASVVEAGQPETPAYSSASPSVATAPEAPAYTASAPQAQQGLTAPVQQAQQADLTAPAAAPEPAQQAQHVGAPVQQAQPEQVQAAPQQSVSAPTAPEPVQAAPQQSVPAAPESVQHSAPQQSVPAPAAPEPVQQAASESARHAAAPVQQARPEPIQHEAQTPEPTTPAPTPVTAPQSRESKPEAPRTQAQDSYSAPEVPTRRAREDGYDRTIIVQESPSAGRKSDTATATDATARSSSWNPFDRKPGGVTREELNDNLDRAKKEIVNDVTAAINEANASNHKEQEEIKDLKFRGTRKARRVSGLFGDKTGDKTTEGE